MSSMDKRLISVHPDGTFSTTIFFDHAKLKGETDEQFYAREIARLDTDPAFASAPRFFLTKSEMRTQVSKHVDGNKRALKYIDGAFLVDNDYKSDIQIDDDNRSVLRNKLKTSLGLSDAEAELLVRR